MTTRDFRSLNQCHLRLVKYCKAPWTINGKWRYMNVYLFIYLFIPKLHQLFSTFGAPHVVKSDNGPPFNRQEFTKFACVLGFKLRKITPLWPRANREVERFVKTLKKCIKAAKVEGRNWRKELQAILRNYRTKPHATNGVAPAVLLLKRPVRNKLPQANHIDPVAEIVREATPHRSSR